jgi:hypothetical protein
MMNPRKGNPGRAEELDRLADWCEFVAQTEFDLGMAKRSSESNKFLKEMLEQKLDAVRRARARGDLKGLRMIYRDTNEMMKGMASEHRDELDRRLHQRFGRGLEAGNRELEGQALDILKKGRIAGAEDFRILDTWLNVILEEPLRQDEVKRISALLATVKQPLRE